MSKMQTNRSWKRRFGAMSSFSMAFLFFLGATAVGSERGRIWFEVYRELNPTEGDEVHDKLWLQNVEAWAKREQSRLEPVILSILRGKRADTDWTRGLSLARVIATPRITDALVGRLQELVTGVRDGCLDSSTREGGAFTTIVTILGELGDDRVRLPATDFASRECQCALVVERCVEALRRVGDKETIVQLRHVPLRQRYGHIDRLCALAERAIDERVSGRDLLANAEGELRSLTARYLHSLETKDPKAYIDVHAFGYRRIADEPKVVQGVFENPEMRDFVRSLKQIAGREVFDIERDSLAASCTIEGRYKLTYVFELEGWRVAGLERVAP